MLLLNMTLSFLIPFFNAIFAVMSSFEKLRLSKQLQIAVSNAGYFQPTGLQSTIFSRINGGQDLVAVSGEGAGKSTALVLAALNKLKQTEEIAPRILIMVSSQERGEELIQQFELLNRNKSLRIYGLFNNGPTLDAQVLELTDGVDIVVAMPDRARSAYLKLGLNLNKLQLFAVDDADEIVANGLQLPVAELGRSVPKAQNLIFSSVYHGKIARMLSYFMEEFDVIEVDNLEQKDVPCVEQILYTVPNFKTKLNLLNLLLEDREVFDKVLVVVGSKFTAETVYKMLNPKEELVDVYTFRCIGFSENNIENLADFEQMPQRRVLIVSEEDLPDLETSNIPFLMFFDIPDHQNNFIQKVVLKNEKQEDQLALCLVTDLELGAIQKIEQELGLRMNRMDLPEDLYVETESKKKRVEKEEENDPTRGGAFHEKKAKNTKTANIKPSERYKKHK